MGFAHSFACARGLQPPAHRRLSGRAPRLRRQHAQRGRGRPRTRLKQRRRRRRRRRISLQRRP
eukprot:8547571-Alexandrium_andersonii.AAC.1